MPSPTTLETHGVSRALAGLRAFADLLACIDADAWNSIGRPRPEGLAVIANTLTAELESELAELRTA